LIGVFACCIFASCLVELAGFRPERVFQVFRPRIESGAWSGGVNPRAYLAERLFHVRLCATPGFPRRDEKSLFSTSKNPNRKLLASHPVFQDGHRLAMEKEKEESPE
jgi:hypothetical protein